MSIHWFGFVEPARRVCHDAPELISFVSDDPDVIARGFGEHGACPVGEALFRFRALMPESYLVLSALDDARAWISVED